MPDLPTPPGRSFASDNAAGAHPAVLEAVTRANAGHALAYGEDDLTRECAARFRELFDADVAIHLTFNGTGANILALASALASLSGPHHGIVCTNWSHIATDETGAPERVLATKLIDLDCPDAKLRPEQLDDLRSDIGVKHHVQPGVVSITQPTELGTLYTVDEISVLCERAHSLGMLVHLDGARIGNATAAMGASTSTLRSFTVDAGVDVISFGGTKNGLLGADAVVYAEPAVAVGSEYLQKQVTQLPSKMRFLAAQFNAALTDDLWIETARHANEMALRLHEVTTTIPGVALGAPPPVNSLFPSLPVAAIDPLRAWSFFWDWDVPRHQVRWMTAWDTSSEDVERFAAGVAAVVGRALDSSRENTPQKLAARN